MSGSEKIAFGEQELLNAKLNPLLIFAHSLKIVHISTYAVMSLLLLKRHQRILLQNYSDIEKVNLEKAAFLLRLFLIISVGAIIASFASLALEINYVVTNNIIGLGISIIIYALAYSHWDKAASHIPNLTLSQATENNPSIINAILSHDTTEVSSSISNTVPAKHRNTYNLSEEECNQLSYQLEELLLKDKLFLQNDFSLAQLSEHLQVQPYLASEVINRRFQETFFDLINRHRIEEVKSRFHNSAYSHFSILGIALDCGFNSKSSFNSAFKKFAGTTPSDFRKAVSQSENMLSDAAP